MWRFLLYGKSIVGSSTVYSRHPGTNSGERKHIISIRHASSQGLDLDFDQPTHILLLKIGIRKLPQPLTLIFLLSALIDKGPQIRAQ